LRLKFWGVRGVIASPGLETEKVGGNTPCIEIRDREDKLVILEAGIGLYWLGRTLLGGPLGKGRGDVALLLSHSHWDHIQGYPFFVPAFIPGNDVRIIAGRQCLAGIESSLEAQMRTEYSPIVSLSNMGATVTYESIGDGDITQVYGLKVAAGVLPHDMNKDTTAFRISEGDASLVYITDVEYRTPEALDAAVAFAKGAKVLIHEAYELYDAEGESPKGHSSFRQATELARRAGVEKLYYFYHHPDHSDTAIDEAVAAERAELERLGVTGLIVETAREGLEIEI